jgi:ATP-dependent helicase/DNAse subunit B
MVIYPDCLPAMDYLEEYSLGRIKNLYESARNFDLRYSNASTSFNGDLRDWARLFQKEFRSSYGWSPSSLEKYHSCPYSFFVGRVLRLKPRQEPAEGMDAAQLGNIYHKIFEQLYSALDLQKRTDPEKLRAILPTIARKIFDQAPAKQGFRETAWWRETREKIADNVARSIAALAEIQEDFAPVEFELSFFDPHTLTVYDGDDHFLLRGFIDRVDRDQQGRSRIIDYKTSGPYNYTKQTLESGDNIQLALYALAARDALDLGEPVDGFYWHILQAQVSKLTLREYGPSAAIDVAVGHAWDSVRGARQGYFLAQPPADGCPSWCPAVSFCWNYRPGMWR